MKTQPVAATNPDMYNHNVRDPVLKLLKSTNSVIESLKSLVLKLFELASLIYLLSKIVLHR